ncbi:phosphoribosylformylglycinamidine synthase subunit PurS [Helicobacter turcicus]|uniref:Phosphoribosylformylglycinamidine synthase subunit PurS n=1 Tax=Helicobacter turcicus TaxID=2867412 RepID=A0ABS7JLB3_9HELI|nr:phosphoribosylformylglycinamidine synthase subunit PurS [Helicobacter turcicus]MBX7490188.1 phosphoribosylformylglycinamidine synthase subunit PurS [Helicobacter turcicus]MBX7545233.1 phosphoribosylformylglycinamidine synthase subunit PurS [Helicobacter turcicus]
MKIEVIVGLKEGVLDPQGKAIHHALESLGFKGVDGVKVGKVITLEINNDDKEAVKKEVESMCEMLLANTVIENYQIKM